MTRWGRICILSMAVMGMGSAGWAAPFEINDGYQLSVIADVTVTNAATLVAAANASRATLNCTNTSASVNVRWGGSDVTATTGQRIPFGAAIEIRNIGAVYMISEGANVTVSCTQETR
jgi:hypothetical protein